MNNIGQNALIWIVLILSVFFLFNMMGGSGRQQNLQEISYNNLINFY